MTPGAELEGWEVAVVAHQVALLVEEWYMMVMENLLAIHSSQMVLLPLR